MTARHNEEPHRLDPLIVALSSSRRGIVNPNEPPALPPPLRRPIGILAVLATAVTAVLAVRYSGAVAAGLPAGWTGGPRRRWRACFHSPDPVPC